MLQHSVDKEFEKKEKSVDWHPNLKQLVRFAASLDGSIPAQTIPLSYRKIINASTVSQADIELLAQMRASGLEDLEWDLLLVNSLRNGSFEYIKMDTPNNFSNLCSE